MKNTLKIGDRLMNLTKPAVMGILNITPDSFYKDSRFNPNGEEFLKKANEMAAEGVDIFDIGGFSTRPGGEDILPEEEINRVIPAIEKLKANFPHIPISIDTFRASVAVAALNAGAEIINDISGGDFDNEMFELVISRNPIYIIMHLQGNLKTMHNQNSYTELYPEILNKLYKKANYLRSNGVKDIVLDPGFGFSKTVEQNYALLSNLDVFENEHFPLLIGMSRKSMIYKLLNTSPEETLVNSTFLHALGIIKGARIIRTHDVKPIKEALTLIKTLNSQKFINRKISFSI
jgi:dihydropteroate synthase